MQKSFIKRLARHKALSVVISGLAITALMLGCYIRQPRLISMLDHKMYDFMLYLYGEKNIGPIPAVIDIDENSLAKYGQWPWPRFLLAHLLQKLTELGVAAVGLDVLLVEKDRSAPVQMQKDLQKYLRLDVDFTGLPDTLRDYDELLARHIRGLPVVLGAYGGFSLSDSAGAHDGGDIPPGVNIIVRKQANANPDFEKFLSKAEGVALPLPELRHAAPMSLLNMSPDADGIVRRIPLLARYSGQTYPTLSLGALMTAARQKNLILNIGRDGLESVRLGQLTIPTATDGSLIIPYKGPAKTYPYFSVKDILEDKIDPGSLKNRIVFLGTSAAGLLDIRITPLERVYPGVEVHATVLDAILQKKFLTAPPWTPGAQSLGILACGLMATAAFGFASPRVYILLGVSLMGLTMYGSAHLFKQGIVFSPLYIAATVPLEGALLLFLRFWQEEQQKKILRDAFSRYVAPEVVNRITRLSGDIFAGEERELTIMFTDIRGFTSISEKLRPQQVVSLLNRYFTPMTSLVRNSGGTLDKFIGDALMAFWNAPLPVESHPLKAVKTALAMQDRLAELNVELQNDFGLAIRMGVGLHTGKAYVGNMGSEELLNYTLIGDNVNLASRLEGLCPKYGVGLVLSAETKDHCGNDFTFQQLDMLRVKGKQHPVEIFTALPAETGKEREQELAEYEKARRLYAEGDFKAALNIFAALLKSSPDSGLYSLYLERCQALLKNPPENWDGIWTMTSK